MRQRLRIAIVVSIVALPGIILGILLLRRHLSACATAESDRQERRAFIAELRTRQACRIAALNALATLQTLGDDERIGLALAMHDSASTTLCGGNADALVRAWAHRDVDATFDALRQLYAIWCPDCPPPQVERPRVTTEDIP